MKKLIILLTCLSIKFASAATPIAAETLPSLVYFLSVDSNGSAPGNHALFGVTRRGAESTVIFRTRLTMDEFLRALPNDMARNLTPMQLPRSMVGSLIAQGGSVLADPVTMTDSGTEVTTEATSKSATDNADLLQMYKEDQSDRLPDKGSTIDLKMVGKRDADRRMRVMKYYSNGSIETGSDYYHAAMILHHGARADDYLLAHEFCIIALSKGVVEAKWLAAASEDRFLIEIGRKQRFGTQLGIPLETDGKLSDRLRRALNVPDLEESIEQSKMIGNH